jgi:hypothetical protein
MLLSSDDMPVPLRYSTARDSKGRLYYLDHELRTTSWMNPVKQAQFESSGLSGIDICVKRTTPDGLEYLVNYNVASVEGPYLSGHNMDVTGTQSGGMRYMSGFRDGKLELSFLRYCRRPDENKTTVLRDVAKL